MKREIAKAFQGIPAVQDSAMTLFRALPTNQIESLGPFVFVDFYETKGTKGIGDSPHPHAGIEVISYLLQGESVHKDSLNLKKLNTTLTRRTRYLLSNLMKTK